MSTLREVEVPFLRANLALQHAIIKGAVRKILERPANYDWQMQGLGMLRLYLSDDLRLHLWHNDFAFAGDSTKHDHPWDFDSLILGGRMVNKRYLVSESGWGIEDSMMHTIKCGPGGCSISKPVEVTLMPMNTESYGPGETYAQKAEEVHWSQPENGTTTVIRRYFRTNRENARVFWPIGKEWQSAEPRPATTKEIVAITTACLGRLQ